MNAALNPSVVVRQYPSMPIYRRTLTGPLAWLAGVVLFIALIAFQLVTCLVLAALLTLSRVCELGVRVFRLIRPA